MASKGPLFEAEFTNREPCPCGEPLVVGDTIGYVDGELSCEGCWNGATDALGFAP